MIDPVTLLALFGPAIKDGFSALVKKVTGDAGSKPANVAEFVQLQEAETRALEARAKVADTDGASYPWVIAAIKLQRPLIVYLTMLVYLGMAATGTGTEDARGTVANFAAVIVFWLFGERYNLKMPGKS